MPTVTSPSRADVWTARVPARYRDDVPHVVRDGPTDLWVLDGKPLSPVGVTAPAGLADVPAGVPADLRRRPPGLVRRRGAAAVHGRGGDLGAGAVPERRRLRQPELPEDRRRGAQAAVRHRRTTTSSSTGRRPTSAGCCRSWRHRSGTSTRPCARSSAASALGARGILFTGEPQRYDLPVIGEPALGPALGGRPAAGLPIHFHIGNAGDTIELRPTPDRYANHGVERRAGVHRGQPLHEERRCSARDLITSGVLQPLPGVEVRVGRERHRVAAVHARRRPTTAGSARSGPAASASRGTCCRRSSSARACT